jgi:hypothetical protein
LKQLNTSNVGRKIVKFTPATKTQKRNSILDPFGLAPSASAAQSALAPGATSTAGAGGFLSSLLGPAQGILGDLGNVFDGIVSNLTTDLDSGLTNLEKGLAANITKELGIQQYYSLYVNGICMGSFDNASDPNSAANSTRCTTYSNAASGMFKSKVLTDFSLNSRLSGIP